MVDEKVKQVNEIIEKLDKKDFSLYFFTLDTKGNPTAGIANIYEHVKVLNELGYNAKILHEKNDYKLRGDESGMGIADWLGEEYAALCDGRFGPSATTPTMQEGGGCRVLCRQRLLGALLPQGLGAMASQGLLQPSSCRQVLLGHSCHKALGQWPRKTCYSPLRAGSGLWGHFCH